MRIRTEKLALPNGYQKVEYIQGTGTQWLQIPDTFDCDYFEFVAQYTDTSSEMCIVGNYYGGGTYRWEIFCSSGRQYYSIWSGYNSQGTSQGTVSALNKAHISYDYSTTKMTVDNTTPLTKVLNSQPKYLFQYGNNGLYAKAKLFDFLEKKNGQVVMHLIPCYRKSDNVIGMYDIINNVFYTNKGSGTFTKGENVNETIPFKVSLVPNIYQELDYIESVGGQGIIVNYKPVSTDKIQSTFAMTKLNVTSCLWCARGSTTATNSLTSFYISNSGVRCDYGTNATMTNIGTLVVNTKHTLLMDGNKWYLDGTLKTSMTAQTFTAGGKIRLFSSYTNGEGSGLGNYSYIKLYEFKVWNKDNELQVHLIPCMRKSDSVVGLYDIVSGTFYPNIGSGSFTKGSNINKFIRMSPRIAGYRGYPGFDIINYKKVENLANSNGAQYLEIPFMPDCSKGFKFEFGFIPTATSKRYALMSNYNQGSYQLSLEINASNKLRLWLNTGNLDKASSNSFNVNQLNIGIFEFKNNTYKITLNGTETSGSYTCSYKSTTETMYAFLDKAKRTSTFPTPIKFTYIKIWEADKLVFNLVPCKTKTGNTYGMYDIINKVFYSNLGTGSFTIGNEEDIEIM